MCAGTQVWAKNALSCRRPVVERNHRGPCGRDDADLDDRLRFVKLGYADRAPSGERLGHEFSGNLQCEVALSVEADVIGRDLLDVGPGASSGGEGVRDVVEGLTQLVGRISGERAVRSGPGVTGQPNCSADPHRGRDTGRVVKFLPRRSDDRVTHGVILAQRLIARWPTRRLRTGTGNASAMPRRG